MKSKPENTVVVKKPFCTGSAVDENTLKSSLLFFGSLLLVYFMSFLVSVLQKQKKVIRQKNRP